MSDPALPDVSDPIHEPLTDPEPAPLTERTGFRVAVGAVSLAALAALVTFVLVVSLGVIGGGLLPATAAARALLTSADVRHLAGVEIESGGRTGVTRSTLEAYVRRNPVGDPGSVRPARCAANIEGWMAWAALDTPSYIGWKHDSVYAATNVVIESAQDFGPGIQQSRNFATVAAATAFMNAERSWYAECGTASYSDPSTPSDSATYAFAPLSVNLGLDSIVEGSTDRGRGAPAHLVDVYLRNRNIVYALEIATNHDPARGLDRVSLAVLNAAAKKLGSVG